MKVAVTGSDGFLGWHLRVRLAALARDEVACLPRLGYSDDEALHKALAGADAVVHLAGVNRDAPDSVEAGNLLLAQRLVSGLDRAGGAPVVVYANSTQAGSDTPYGRGKQRGAEALAGWAERSGAPFVDVLFPNLFGEGGRPYYNSFVSTFCHRLAHGDEPAVDADREVPLLHAQGAADLLVSLLTSERSAVVRPAGRTSRVSDIKVALADLAATYASGKFPDLSDPFAVQLFNTYRSYLYPHGFPRPLARHSDHRGSFVEVVQSFGGQGQTSFSTTSAGVIRGQHFHLRKVERFAVIRGTAEIAMRAVGRDTVHRYRVSGDSPAYVDMPTLWTHNITNIGDDELWTLFWISEIFDPGDPDTFPENVV